MMPVGYNFKLSGVNYVFRFHVTAVDQSNQHGCGGERSLLFEEPLNFYWSGSAMETKIPDGHNSLIDADTKHIYMCRSWQVTAIAPRHRQDPSLEEGRPERRASRGKG